MNMAKEKRGRVVRMTKEVSRLFRQIKDYYEDVNSNKTPNDIADEIWELGVRMKSKELQNIK